MLNRVVKNNYLVKLSASIMQTLTVILFHKISLYIASKCFIFGFYRDLNKDVYSWGTQLKLDPGAVASPCGLIAKSIFNGISSNLLPFYRYLYAV